MAPTREAWQRIAFFYLAGAAVAGATLLLGAMLLNAGRGASSPASPGLTEVLILPFFWLLAAILSVMLGFAAPLAGALAYRMAGRWPVAIRMAAAASGGALLSLATYHPTQEEALTSGQFMSGPEAWQLAAAWAVACAACAFTWSRIQRGLAEP